MSNSCDDINSKLDVLIKVSENISSIVDDMSEASIALSNKAQIVYNLYDKVYEKLLSFKDKARNLGDTLCYISGNLEDLPCPESSNEPELESEK